MDDERLCIELGALYTECLVYALTREQGCLLLMFGRIADVYGRKKTFLAGAAWLFAFGLGCGFCNGACSFHSTRKSADVRI